jgi:hypothetical protein
MEKKQNDNDFEEDDFIISPAPKGLKDALEDIEAKDDSRLTMFSPNGSKNNFALPDLAVPKEQAKSAEPLFKKKNELKRGSKNIDGLASVNRKSRQILQDSPEK